MVSFGSELLAAVCGEAGGAVRASLRHVTEMPARRAESREWPPWVGTDLLDALRDRGITAAWSHQIEAAEFAHSGRDVVISTGTASGKSLAFQLPIMDALARDPRARALYLSPTKALGHDQLRCAHELSAAVPRLADVAPSAYDGDTGPEVRRFARERSRWLFSNPDMIHVSMLRNHARWAIFLRGLRYIVVDECHYYRGVFGSNVAMILRRLLRLCDRYRSPGSAAATVIFASATTAAPGATAAELIGRPVEEVVVDGSPQGARTIALWEPALRTDLRGENGAPDRPYQLSEQTRTTPSTSAAQPAAVLPSWRPALVGYWGAPRPPGRRRPCTPGRFTCTRARAIWLTRSALRTGWRSFTPRIPGTRHTPGRSPTSP